MLDEAFPLGTMISGAGRSIEEIRTLQPLYKIVKTRAVNIIPKQL